MDQFYVFDKHRQLKSWARKLSFSAYKNSIFTLQWAYDQPETHNRLKIYFHKFFVQKLFFMNCFSFIAFILFFQTRKLRSL